MRGSAIATTAQVHKPRRDNLRRGGGTPVQPLQQEHSVQVTGLGFSGIGLVLGC